MNEVTQLLQAVDRGDAKSADALLPLVYEELRKLAASKMAREAPGQTLQPTALVHEAWLRLAGGAPARFNDRAHFFGAAAEAMRRILIERARRKAALRHGGGQQRVDMDEIEIAAPAPDDELLAVNEALDKFAALDAPKTELVKLRFFAGLDPGAGGRRARRFRANGQAMVGLRAGLALCGMQGRPRAAQSMSGHNAVQQLDFKGLGKKYKVLARTCVRMFSDRVGGCWRALCKPELKSVIIRRSRATWSIPGWTRPSIGSAKIHSGPCPWAWLAAPSN